MTKRISAKKVDGSRERTHCAAGNGRDVKVIKHIAETLVAALGARAQGAMRRK